MPQARADEPRPLAIRDFAFTPPAAPAAEVPALLRARPDSHLRILYLRGRGLAERREQLAGLGVEVLSYLPHDAFVVRMGPELRTRVDGLSWVRWSGPLHPAYRIPSALREQIVDGAVDDGARRYRIAAFRRGGGDKERLIARIAELGGQVVTLSTRGYMLDASLTLAQVAELVHSDDLMYVQAWGAPQADMDVVRELSGANAVETVTGYDGAGLNAEVMDVGTQVDHQDFDTPPMIEHGGPALGGSHGTATYGIVFGNGDRDGDGDGTALGLNPAGQGYYANSGVGDRLAHTLELNDPAWEAVFQTNSWGSPRNLVYDAESMEMDDIVLQSDVLIFQSQSNAGARDSRPQAWSKNVVSVGGFNHNDTADLTDDCWCNTGSIGPAEDGRIKPDLSHFYDATWTTTSGDGYANFGGTSGATPITAGVSGILYQMWADDLWDTSPTGSSIFAKRPHPSTMKALLINTAEQHDFSGPGDDMARVHQGWGMANAGQAYDRTALTRVVDETSPLVEGESDSYLASVAAGQPFLKVTLVYTDWPGAPLSAVNLVNDLSLQVISPSGTRYWGNNGLEDGPWSVAGGAADTLNNVENVFIENPEEGTWEIQVLADTVIEDVHTETAAVDQDYALVASGTPILNGCGALVSPPTAPAATAAGDNQITISWTGTAPEHRVLRSVGGCEGPFKALATVAAPGSAYDDTTVSGGVTYGYVIKAVDGCESVPTACVEATTTGDCLLEAEFDGARDATAVPAAACGIEVTWQPGESICGGTLVYNVYRSTDPVFTPDPSNRIAQCVGGTSYYDADALSHGQNYTYVVRAEDLSSMPATGPCGGNEEENGARVTSTPLGPEIVIYSATFDSGLDGWFADFAADTGNFEAGDPIGTMDGAEPAQPEDCFAGECLFSGQNPGGVADDGDIDRGRAIASSPLIDASAHSALRLRFQRWYYDGSPGGFAQPRYDFAVSNDGGGNWELADWINDADPSENFWVEVDVAIESIVSLTDQMMLRVRCADFEPGPGLIVEMAIDEVELLTNDVCSAGQPDLLRNDEWRRGDSPGLYLPLHPVDDLYQPGFSLGSADPDPNVLEDARPLIFYGFSLPVTVKLVKTPTGVEIH